MQCNRKKLLKTVFQSLNKDIQYGMNFDKFSHINLFIQFAKKAGLCFLVLQIGPIQRLFSESINQEIKNRHGQNDPSNLMIVII